MVHVMQLVVGSLALWTAQARHSGSALRAVNLASNKAANYGNPKCPCVGLDDVKGEVSVAIDKTTKMNFPAELGAACEAWEQDRHPSCPRGTDKDLIKNGTNPSFCAKSWCYVDPCKCDIGVTPVVTAYLPDATYQGHPVYYTYATCGSEDTYTKAHHKAACVNQQTKDACGKLTKCAWAGGKCMGKEVQQAAQGVCKDVKALDNAKFGADNCRCVGIDNLEGSIELDLGGGKKPAIPASASWGSTCQGWDDTIGHPDCTKAEPAKWCKQKWCYVDPCTCGQADPPKVSAWLHMAKFQGKTVYYSYSTCGNADTFTEEVNVNACVNQKSESGCNKNPKCAWSSTGCLGKEIAYQCGVPRAGAQALAPVGAFALLLAFHL